MERTHTLSFLFLFFHFCFFFFCSFYVGPVISNLDSTNNNHRHTQPISFLFQRLLFGSALRFNRTLGFCIRACVRARHTLSAPSLQNCSALHDVSLLCDFSREVLPARLVSLTFLPLVVGFICVLFREKKSLTKVLKDSPRRKTKLSGQRVINDDPDGSSCERYTTGNGRKPTGERRCRLLHSRLGAFSL